jgi:hypothetical protein
MCNTTAFLSEPGAVATGLLSRDIGGRSLPLPVLISDTKRPNYSRIRLRAIKFALEETDMHCIDCTLQALLLDIVGSSIFIAAMIKLMGTYKYLGYLV